MIEASSFDIPVRYRGLGSEYDNGWLDIKSAAPRIEQACLSTTQLFVNPQNWIPESFRVGEARHPTHPSDQQISVVLYSQTREKPRFTKKDLILDLGKVVRPDLLAVVSESTSSLKRVLRWIELPPVDIPPFRKEITPENQNDFFLVKSLTIRDFNIWLRVNADRDNFEDPGFDPRRVIVEIMLENPTAKLLSAINSSRVFLNNETTDSAENKRRLPTTIHEQLQQLFAEYNKMRETLTNFLKDPAQPNN